MSHKFTDNLQPSLLQQHLPKCSPLLWQSTTDQSIHKMKTHQEPPWTEWSSSTTAAKAMETTFVASEMFYCIQQKGTTINSNFLLWNFTTWMGIRKKCSEFHTADVVFLHDNAFPHTANQSIPIWHPSCDKWWIILFPTSSPSNTPCTKWLAFFTAHTKITEDHLLTWHDNTPYEHAVTLFSWCWYKAKETYTRTHKHTFLPGSSLTATSHCAVIKYKTKYSQHNNEFIFYAPSHKNNENKNMFLCQLYVVLYLLPWSAISIQLANTKNIFKRSEKFLSFI